MIAARTRIAALAIVVFFALTSILWGSTAAHAADGLSISGTVYLGSNATPATTGTVQVEYTLVGEDHVATDFVPVASDGTWTIPGLSSGNYFIYYHYLGSEGYASKYQSQEAVLTYPYAAGQTVLGDTDVTDLGEVLEKTGTVSGHVILGTAAATAGQVSVTASVFAGESGGTAQYTTLAPVSTDASGNYTITGLAPGSNWRLFFTSNVTGFQSVYYGQVLDDDGQSFSVDGGAALTKNQTVPVRMSISGHVYLGTTATTAGGGDVTLQLREYNSGVLNTTLILTTTTAVGGGYSFTGLDNRQFQVTPVYSGSGAYVGGDPSVFSATTTTADFTLAASGSTTTFALTGHVDIGTDGNSAQANEIYVGLLTADQETLVTTTLTDAHGDYSFPGLVAGSYHVVYANYSHPNQDSWPVYSLAQVGPGLTAPSITFPVYNISGHINLAGTTAARAGDVLVRASNGAGFVATTSTDASGNYTFSLPEGKYSIGFRFAGDTTDDVQTSVVTYSDLRQLMNSDQTVPTPVLTAYDWISGTVTLPSGAAATSVTVRADRYDADGNFLDTRSQILPSGAGGYAFTKLPFGTYEVSFVPADGSSVAPQSYNDKSIYSLPTDLVGTAVGGTVFANINATLHAGGAVAGSVVGAPDYTGDDVRVEVEVFDPSSLSYVGTGDVYPVAADGSYAINGLLPNRYVIEANYSGPGGNITVDSATVDVTASATTSLDIVLAPPSVPRGTVSFLRALYNDFLNREPSQVEIGGWAAVLQGGLPRGGVAGGFVNSDEYRLIRIDAAYEDLLNRAAEPAGRLGWLNGMKRGVLTTDDIEQSLYSSDEFFNLQGGTNGDFVQALYTDILHRSASVSEWQGWSSQIDAHTLSRAGLVSIFWRSLETGRERVSLMFTKYFGRPASESDRVYWGDFILKYGDSAARSALTGSQEYYNHAQDQYSPPAHNAS